MSEVVERTTEPAKFVVLCDDCGCPLDNLWRCVVCGEWEAPTDKRVKRDG